VLQAVIHGVVATTGSTAAATPAPSPTGSPEPVVGNPLQTAAADCGQGDGTVCGWVFDQTGSKKLGAVVDVFVGRPLQVLLIIVVAIVVRWLLHRAVDRLAGRVASGETGPGGGNGDGNRRRSMVSMLSASPLATERRVQRARTMASVLKSTGTGVIFTIAGLMALSVFDVNIGPLLAGASILGVALGFGAQSLVKDFLSGLFMILEDQYGVGDVIDAGEATGTVEAVGLRVTRLRDVEGTVWYLRNGEILRVGNKSQGWARVVLDIGVAYHEDVAHVQELLLEVAREVHDDPAWGELFVEDPEVWGVESLAADSVVLRLVVKTLPLKQWNVARELRLRIKARFDAEGIEIPFPQRSLWVRDGPPADQDGDQGAGGASAGDTRSRPEQHAAPDAPDDGSQDSPEHGGKTAERS
jgi:small conductance mechanosensitive channel